jgi:hypothetical protein
MNKTIILELTEAQARVLLNHLSVDLSYGSEGTFSNMNGEYDKREGAVAERIIKKLEEAL